MKDIICPNCNTAFKIDESGYTDILKQVRDEQFDNEINNRLKLAENENVYLIYLNLISYRCKLSFRTPCPKT